MKEIPQPDYKPAKVVIVEEKFIPCPECNHAPGFRVTGRHDGEDAGRRLGPWHCDECGWAFDLIFTKGEWMIARSPLQERRFTTIVKLKLKPQTQDVFFYVEGLQLTGPRVVGTNDDPVLAPPLGVVLDSEHDRYFYDEHTCTTNWLGQVVAISVGDEGDPHGDLAEYVSTKAIGPGDVEVGEEQCEF